MRDLSIGEFTLAYWEFAESYYSNTAWGVMWLSIPAGKGTVFRR